MILCFSFVDFRIFSIYFTSAILNYDMSWSGSIWVHLFWDPLCFLYLDSCFLRQVWEVLTIISSNTFLNPLSISSPSETPIMWTLLHLMFSQSSLKLFSFLNLFFPLLFKLGDFHYSIFQITYHSSVSAIGY